MPGCRTMSPSPVSHTRAEQEGAMLAPRAPQGRAGQGEMFPQLWSTPGTATSSAVRDQAALALG